MLNATKTDSKYVYLGEHGAVQFVSGPYRGAIDFDWIPRNDPRDEARIEVQRHELTDYERSVSLYDAPPVGTVTCRKTIPTAVLSAIFEYLGL